MDYKHGHSGTGDADSVFAGITSANGTMSIIDTLPYGPYDSGLDVDKRHRHKKSQRKKKHKSKKGKKKKHKRKVTGRRGSDSSFVSDATTSYAISEGDHMASWTLATHSPNPNSEYTPVSLRSMNNSAASSRRPSLPAGTISQAIHEVQVVEHEAETDKHVERVFLPPPTVFSRDSWRALVTNRERGFVLAFLLLGLSCAAAIIALMIVNDWNQETSGNHHGYGSNWG